MKVLDEVTGSEGYVLPSDAGHALFEPCPFVDRINFRANAIPYLVVVTDENSDVPYQRPNQVRTYGNGAKNMLETGVPDNIDGGQVLGSKIDAPLQYFSASDCDATFLDNIDPASNVGPWLRDIQARAQDILSSGASITMFLNGSHPIVPQQLGSSAQQAENKADFSAYDAAATLANLKSAGYACSLQAQLLQMSAGATNAPDVRVYDIEAISSTGIVESFFSAVADGIGKKRCGTAKKRAGACQCDPCDAFECVAGTCQRVDQCDKETCVNHCNIDGKCYLNRQYDPSDTETCRQCRPEDSKTSWTQNVKFYKKRKM